ncbi:MAG: translation initiation factor IF-6 [Candidatus Thermoplasmatota archaeon]|nr:translation initiation factor IF-6 [Candidatus Thermoplasmatota archaeon]MBS3789943.1 translation initiation factor IF-6 [Candidatus Thermoplasmatota archaeon]
MLKKYAIESHPYIGVFSSGSEELVVIPPVEEDVFEKALDCPVVKTTIGGTRVNGSLMGMNSKGAVVSDIIEDREIEKLLEYTTVTVIPDAQNALGNNILLNDRGALIHPDIGDEAKEAINSELEVEVKRGTIAGIQMVGSVGVATNKGVLCHPHVNEGEIEKLEKLFGVPVSKGTANHGSGWIGTCLVANTTGAVIGNRTTPIEMGRIEEGLRYLED